MILIHSRQLGSRVLFPGFSAVYEDSKKEETPQLPALKKSDVVETVLIDPETTFYATAC